MGAWHDSITLQILPGINIGVQYMKYTSEYIPKLHIHQQNQHHRDHSRWPSTPSKGHKASDLDSKSYQSKPDLHTAPSSPMAGANLDPFCLTISFQKGILCWCNCNFRLYSLVYLMYCTPMFISRIFWVMSCPDVPIGSFYIVNKSCQVIVGNPPIDQGLKSPQSWGPRP